MLCMQRMLRFSQTARISASDALKSKYFANLANGGETADDSNLSLPSSSSLTSSEADQDSDEFDRDEIQTASAV